MEENWYALFISIIKGVSVETAFLSLYRQIEKSEIKIIPQNKYESFTDEDIEKMIELKKKMTYKQVAKIFNTIDRNVYNHIKKYRPDLIKSDALGYRKARRGNGVFQNGFSA